MKLTRIAIFVVAGICCSADAADISEAVRLYKSGEYAKCAEFTGAAIEAGEFSETWRVLKAKAELATGDYVAAIATYEKARERIAPSRCPVASVAP